jgi:hypothetical protein
MTPTKRLLTALSGMVLLWGIFLAIGFLLLSKGRFDFLAAFSIAISLAGAIGLFKVLKPSRKN